VKLEAPDIQFTGFLQDMSVENPLAAAINGVLHQLGIPRSPACMIKVTSTIPVAAGMGSGAAVTVALVRAFSAFIGSPLPDELVSALTYEVEKIHHGTPSGIDNTVITYSRPVFFQRREAGAPLVEIFSIYSPLQIVIGDTGISSPTSQAVGDVRRGWLAELERYNTLFAAVGEIARSARKAIESGNTSALGPLMNENHRLLQELGVSHPKLDRLVEAARDAGSLGAKLAGAGRGGNMIALAPGDKAQEIARALEAAGATRTIATVIP
jgi:mevalonate kinase